MCMDRFRSRRIHALLISVFSIVSTSCGNTTGHHVERFEVEGAMTVRTTGGPKYDTPLLELENDLVLGVDEGEPAWQMFSRTPRFLIAPDGRIVLIDTSEFIIRVVSPDGELLHQMGGEGSGPGEFQNILDTFWAEEGHEFWLTDQRNNRITRFSIDGALLGSLNYSEIRMSHSRFWHLGHRTFLALGRDRPVGDPSGAGQRYAVMNDKLEITQELFTLEGPQFYKMSEFSFAGIPWTGYDQPIVTPIGQILMIQPNYPRLSLYTQSAEPLLHIERDWEPVPVTQKEKQDFKDSVRERNPDAQVGSISLPSHKPPFLSAVVDTEGRIWLRRYEAIREEGTEEEPGELIGYIYEIYSVEGVWLGTHINQRAIREVHNGYLYQTRLSEAGAPRLERLRIIPLVREMQSGKDG